MNANRMMIVKKNLTYLGTMPGAENDNIDYAATAVRNIESLGYTVSSEVFNCLRRSDAHAIVKWYQDTVAGIQEAKGGQVQHRPMYKGFPDEVMEMSKAKLYIDQLMHYIGKAFGMLIMPVSEEVDRFPLVHKKELVVLGLATNDDIHDYVGNLMSSNASISDEDKSTIEWYFTTFREFGVKIRVPSELPNRENKVIVAKCLHALNLNQYLPTLLTTATDILRFAVALSDGDVSLAEKTKFRNFKRSERRMIMILLEALGTNAIEDMFRQRMAWIRLGERIHPGDFANKYQVAAGCFTYLRNEKFRSFNSEIETLIEAGDVVGAAKKLKSRPGEFARRLDKLLRECSDNTVMNLFDTVADKVSTPVLIQVRDHFKNRGLGLPRFVIPKGPVATIKTFPEATAPVDDYICNAMVAICEEALMKKFKEFGPLGKVYIDPRLENFLLPTAQRSSNPALLQVSRGSKFDIDEGNTLRFFLYWKGYLDIDLSAVFFDGNWNKKGHISYTNLCNTNIGACHSGDIRCAPNGASEFIDMDLNKLESVGVRYAAMSVLSYSHVPFDEIDECFAGWMVRQNDTGEIYEPKTVQNKFDITTAAKTVMPAIFDVKERKVIWTDMTFGSSRNNNIEGNLEQIKLVGDVFANMEKMTLQELFVLHAMARGAEMVEREEADIVYAEDGNVRPYDLDVIAAEYMA